MKDNKVLPKLNIYSAIGGIVGFIIGVLFCVTSSVFIAYTVPQKELPTPMYAVTQIMSTSTVASLPATLSYNENRGTLEAGKVIITGKITQTAEAPIYPITTTQPIVVTPEQSTSLTMAQLNAVRQAESYISHMAFSRTGLIDQLVYEQYGVDDATFAVDFLNEDWTEQAYLSAKSYLSHSSFSLPELIEQLEYEGFTPEQATAGATRAYSE